MKEDLLRDADDIFLYLYELLYVSARGFFRAHPINLGD